MKLDQGATLSHRANSPVVGRMVLVGAMLLLPFSCGKRIDVQTKTVDWELTTSEVFSQWER